MEKIKYIFLGLVSSLVIFELFGYVTNFIIKFISLYNTGDLYLLMRIGFFLIFVYIIFHYIRKKSKDNSKWFLFGVISSIIVIVVLYAYMFYRMVLSSNIWYI